MTLVVLIFLSRLLRCLESLVNTSTTSSTVVLPSQPSRTRNSALAGKLETPRMQIDQTTG
jgi:hypothetical protein